MLYVSFKQCFQYKLYHSNRCFNSAHAGGWMEMFPGNTFISDLETHIEYWQLPVHRSLFQALLRTIQRMYFCIEYRHVSNSSSASAYSYDTVLLFWKNVSDNPSQLLISPVGYYRRIDSIKSSFRSRSIELAGMLKTQFYI